MTEVDAIRQLSPQQLLALGLNDIAYLREVPVDGGTAVAIFAANGQPLAVLPDEGQARAAANEHGLAAFTVH
jgi:hypothetical protein